MSLLIEPCAHIVFGGEMTAPILRRIFPSHVIIPLEDTLSFGPIRRGLDATEWGRLRASFWLESPSGEQPQSVEDYAALVHAAATLPAKTRFVIWLGQTLAEYFAMIWSAVILRQLGMPGRRIFHVIAATDAAHTGEIPCLVGMDEKELRAQWARLRPLSETEYGLIVHAWDAWSSEDPRALWRFVDTFGSAKNTALPDVVDRVARLRSRYPASQSGLDRISRDLLEAAAAYGPVTPRVVAEFLAARDADPDKVPDQIALRRLMRFGDRQLAHPLLHVEGDRGEPYTTRLWLTEVGERVLSGHANHVDLNGIDEWIGGVHLMAPPGPVWYVRDNSLDQK